MPTAGTVTVVIRGEDAALLRERAEEKGYTPEAYVLRLIRKDARVSEQVKATWARPGRREVMSAAMKAGWAKAKALAQEAATPQDTPEASNGHHSG